MFLLSKRLLWIYYLYSPGLFSMHVTAVFVISYQNKTCWSWPVPCRNNERTVRRILRNIRSKYPAPRLPLKGSARQPRTADSSFPESQILSQNFTNERIGTYLVIDVLLAPFWRDVGTEMLRELHSASKRIGIWIFTIKNARVSACETSFSTSDVPPHPVAENTRRRLFGLARASSLIDSSSPKTITLCHFLTSSISHRNNTIQT